MRPVWEAGRDGQPFHNLRDRMAGRGSSPWRRLWQWHNRHPMPAWANGWVRRYPLYWVRRTGERRRYRADMRVPVGAVDSAGDVSVPRDRLLPVRHAGFNVTAAEVLGRLETLEEVNHALRVEGRGWVAQPYALYAGKGVAIEEMYCRFMGYLYAYRATGEPRWEAKAAECAALVRARLFARGHVLLQGHLVLDLPYTMAAEVLYRWGAHTKEAAWVDEALRVADVLAGHQVSGSINHGIMPCAALAEGYRVTGKQRYLSAAWGRVKRTALRYQLSCGGWAGHEQWSWYHGITTQALVATYQAMPFDMRWQAAKDRLAGVIVRATNRLIAMQRADGSIKPGRGTSKFDEVDGEWGSRPANEMVRFEGGRFASAPSQNGEHPMYAWEMLCLLRLVDELGMFHVADLVRGYVGVVSRQPALWRAEMQTMGMGIGLYLLKCLDEHPYTKLRGLDAAVVGGEVIEPLRGEAVVGAASGHSLTPCNTIS